MGVVILGSTTGPTVLGGEGTVTTDTTITTLPVASPISIFGTGARTDSYWELSANKITPAETDYTVGLGTVAAGTLADNILLYDPSGRVVKQIAGTSVSSSAHNHSWSDIVSGTPTSIIGYNIADQLQPLDADLTAIAGLGYVSTSFLKKTAVNTWALDTNTYSVSSHTHAYEASLGNPATDDYILSSKANGTRSWVVPPTGGGSGVTDHGMLTGLSDNDHTQYPLKLNAEFTTSFGFASTSWRFSLSGNDLIISYNGTPTGKLSTTGAWTVLNEVTAFGTI